VHAVSANGVTLAVEVYVCIDVEDGVAGYTAETTSTTRTDWGGNHSGCQHLLLKRITCPSSMAWNQRWTEGRGGTFEQKLQGPGSSVPSILSGSVFGSSGFVVSGSIPSLFVVVSTLAIFLPGSTNDADNDDVCS